MYANENQTNKAIVTITNDSFWTVRDIIRISDDRYLLIYRVNVRSSPEEFNPFNLAAAISVIKASCGWDESPSMVVMINSDEVCVWPRFDGQHWVVGD